MGLPTVNELVEVVYEPGEALQPRRVALNVGERPVFFRRRGRPAESAPVAQVYRGLEIAARFLCEALREFRRGPFDLFAVHHEETLRRRNGPSPPPAGREP